VEGSGDSRNELGSAAVARSGGDLSGAGPAGVPPASTAQSWQAGVGARLGLCPEEVGMPAEDQDTEDVAEELTDEDVDELLVEEVSIDGMCGVY
jgi:mycofactocin precursor